MNDDDPQTDSIGSHKRINLFICIAKKRASAGPQLMLRRALLKKYGIVFPNKGRTKQEQKEGGEPRDGG